MRRLGGIFSVLGLGLLTGGMLLFPVMTLLIFTRLPFDVAGPFVRGCFPAYYAFMLVLSVLAGIGFALRGERKTALLPWAVSLITVWAWLWLIPLLDSYRLAGNQLDFDRGHTLSVWIDGLEFVVMLVLLIREGVRSGKAES